MIISDMLFFMALLKAALSCVGPIISLLKSVLLDDTNKEKVCWTFPGI